MRRWQNRIGAKSLRVFCDSTGDLLHLASEWMLRGPDYTTGLVHPEAGELTFGLRVSAVIG